MNIEKRLRVMEIYAVVSIMVFCVLAAAGCTRTKEKFVEIDVERINDREKNGQLVMVVANSSIMPDPIVNGK
ncbi:MAG: hypothetical protein AB7J13_08690, partial [Pyrinomonadaceae bacterium]